jgi:hypothetical protein
VLRFQGDVEHFVDILQTTERVQSRQRIGRVSTHRPQRLGIVDRVDDGCANTWTGVLACDDDHFLVAAQQDQLTDRLGCAIGLVGFSREAGEAADGLGANVFVGIGPRDVAEFGDVVQPRDRGAPHACFSILARELSQRIAVVGTEVVDSGGANAGVGVLPPRLRTEFLENTHTTCWRLFREPSL